MVNFGALERLPWADVLETRYWRRRQMIKVGPRWCGAMQYALLDATLVKALYAGISHIAAEKATKPQS